MNLYLTEKLSKLRSFDKQLRRPQNCTFQLSFTQRTAQFTQGIPKFLQFTCRHHHLTFYAFFSFFSDVASKPQTTALFLSTIVTRTIRHTELTNLCCARENSVQFFVQFFLHSNLECMGPFILRIFYVLFCFGKYFSMCTGNDL